jgi:hypothetical protein
MKDVTVQLLISEGNAWALAQFCKRIGWREMRQCAVDDEEAQDIRAAIEQLQKALAEVGIAPR